MIPFVYGQSTIYYNVGANPVPRWVYGQPVLNYEFSQSSGELTATSITTPSPVLGNPELSSVVTELTATGITLSTPVLGTPVLAIVLTAVVVPSRVSGTAPLSVFFDASGSVGLSDPGFFANDAAYMDATFAWNFDQTNVDPDSNYRMGSGFVAAHVFENTGTYTVRCTLYDAEGNTTHTDTTITVSAFSGTTYYVAANGSDSNPGTIDLPFLTPAYALSSTHLAPNVRVLFRNGDTFTIANQVNINNETGPIIISGYSDPANPSTSKPLIHTTSVDLDWATIYFTNCSDIRIMNIAVRATAEHSNAPRYPYGIWWNNTCTHMLKYRTEEYENGGIGLSPNGQYTTIAECVFHNTTQTGFTSSDEGNNDGNALIGNIVYDKNLVDQENEEHVFRLQSGSRYFIAHNHFGPGNFVSYDSLTIRGNTEKVVIYSNRLHGWVQAFRPQNKNSANEYQHHCIMDSNLIIGQGQFENDRINAIEIDAKDIVIRNNIIYDYQMGLSICNDTVVGAAQRIKIYNNTFIHPRSSDPFNVIMIDTQCSNIDIKNNIVLKLSSPVLGSFIDINNGSTLSGESDYNILYHSALTNNTAIFDGSSLVDWRTNTGNDTHSVIANPLFISTDYDNENFGRLRADSPAIGTGVATQAALDYYGNLRSSNKDIGAVGRPSIVINHASVDLYDNIPDTYITEVKKMLFMVRGESHSGAYYAGLNALETLDSKFAYTFNQSGAPEAYTDQYLRHNMYYRFGTSWEQYMGEEEVFTSSTARSSMITGNTYMETNYPDQWIIFGFGWCWDMNWTNDPTTTKDTQYGCGWAGSTSGGPEGNLAWGLNADDFAITGNTVCMDTYINAVRAYNDNFTSAKSIWLYTTGPVDSYSGEAGWQRQVKHDYIRNYVRDNGGVLFDFADILCWTNAGVQNTETWTDGNSVVHTYQNITSESMSGYEGTGYHFGPEGALRLGKAIWVMLAQVAGWVPSNVTELTAIGITATAAVLGAPSLTNNTEDSTNCYRWINAELISIEKTSSADVWINGNIVSILEEDSGEMTATGIVASTPVLGTPVLQLNETPLTADGITSSTPSIGTPALVNYAVLTATEIISSSPVIGTPILQNQLIPSWIVASIPVLGNPAVSINLTAISLVAASPVLGTPAVSINIVPTGIVATSPVLGTPGLVNYAVLTANGISTPSPVLGSPSVDSNTTDLTATSIEGTAPILGTPILQSNLVANSIISTSPVLGQPLCGSIQDMLVTIESSSNSTDLLTSYIGLNTSLTTNSNVNITIYKDIYLSTNSTSIDNVSLYMDRLLSLNTSALSRSNTAINFSGMFDLEIEAASVSTTNLSLDTVVSLSLLGSSDSAVNEQLNRISSLSTQPRTNSSVTAQLDNLIYLLAIAPSLSNAREVLSKDIYLSTTATSRSNSDITFGGNIYLHTVAASQSSASATLTKLPTYLMCIINSRSNCSLILDRIRAFTLTGTSRSNSNITLNMNASFLLVTTTLSSVSSLLRVDDTSDPLEDKSNIKVILNRALNVGPIILK